MHRVASSVALLASVLLCGCASMCDSSFDCDFHAFGGMRERIDRTNGRVGSIFDPATAAPSALPPQDFSEDPPTSVLPADDQAAQDPSAQENPDDSEDVQNLLDELDKMKSNLPVIPSNPQDSPTLDSTI